jgi:hypothetical protein
MEESRGLLGSHSEAGWATYHGTAACAVGSLSNLRLRLTRSLAQSLAQSLTHSLTQSSALVVWAKPLEELARVQLKVLLALLRKRPSGSGRQPRDDTDGRKLGVGTRQRTSTQTRTLTLCGNTNTNTNTSHAHDTHTTHTNTQTRTPSHTHDTHTRHKRKRTYRHAHDHIHTHKHAHTDTNTHNRLNDRTHLVHGRRPGLFHLADKVQVGSEFADLRARRSRVQVFVGLRFAHLRAHALFMFQCFTCVMSECTHSRS